MKKFCTKSHIICGLVCVLVSIFAVSCLTSTPKVVGTEHIDLNEFKTLFAHSNLLDSTNCSYHGNKDGFIYLSINGYPHMDKVEGRRIREIYRFIVPEDHIEFTPRMEFVGYGPVDKSRTDYEKYPERVIRAPYDPYFNTNGNVHVTYTITE